MGEIDERVTEAVEQAAETKSRFNAIVALLVAVTATFMAICNVKDSNIGQSMTEAQAHMVDSWSYYQAKSTKQALAEATLDQLTTMRELSPPTLPASAAALDRRIAVYTARVQRYEREKAPIKAEAEGFQKRYQELNVHDDQFDLSEAALALAIALCGVAALTQKRWLLMMAIAFILFGMFFGLAGFLGWSTHPDALMKFLS